MIFKKKEKKTIGYYQDELKRKDREIEELKNHNELLLKSALKSSQRVEELREKLEKYSKSRK